MREVERTTPPVTARRRTRRTSLRRRAAALATAAPAPATRSWHYARAAGARPRRARDGSRLPGAGFKRPSSLRGGGSVLASPSGYRRPAPGPRFADDRYGSQSACSPPFVRRPPPPERGTVSASRDWRDADVPTVAIAIAIPRLQVNDAVASAPAAAIRGGPLQSHPSVLLQHTPHSPGPSPGASGGGFSWYEWRVATSAS